MELINILNIKKTDSFENLGKIFQIDDENYKVIPFDENIESVFIKKDNMIRHIKIKLNKNIKFKIFKEIFKEIYIALYNSYDEETFFNYKYEDRVISFICNGFFVDNEIEALISEIQIDFYSPAPQSLISRL